MQDLVSNRRVSILAAAVGLSVLWAVFVMPGGAPWTGMVWLGALMLLLVSTVALYRDAPATSLVAVTQTVDEVTAARKP